MNENSESYTIFPIFMLVDVSASMAGGPIEALNEAMPEIKKVMLSDPTVGEIARVALVTFSDDARTLIPLCDLADAPIPEVMVESGTNFAAGFRETRSAIESGLRSLPKGTPFYRPVVFFLSDGEHIAREDYRPALAELKDPNWKFAPEVVTFGLGEARKEALQEIASRFAFMANDTNPADAVREIINALISSIRTTSRSFHDPNQVDGLHIDAPRTHFTPLEKLSA
ncbi:VWA domain-containing protein [Kribbella sp. NPDC051620]|uniref:vWA domain-containing protein n=1 Tax=Kribbella sp. NPDC051620 TaxID=3364120 RepID=UPI0037875FE8